MNEKTVGVIACEFYEPGEVRRALEELLTATGGLDFVRPGMKIAIKTNLLTASDPEKAIVSHPAVLAALTELLVEKGASVMVGDSPGGPFTEGHLKHVYKVSGLETVTAAGASLNMNFSQTEDFFAKGKLLQSLTCTSWLKEADAIIGVCKLKTHGMMAMSANVKNFFGAIPGTMKPEYHFRFPKHEDFADMLVDINEYLKPALYITDAVVGMEGNGPSAGTPRKIGALMAAKNPYNADVVCAEIIGLDPLSVPTIAAAKARGLCSMDLAEMELIGDPKAFYLSDFDNIKKLRSIQFGDNIPAFLVPIGRMLLQSKPMVKKKECIGCMKCAGVCPAKAITRVDKKPKIDESRCIRCFCCQEFCPEGAMKVHRPLIAKLLQH